MSISSQYLTRQERKLFYQSFYLPSMRYHLTVGTFTAQQLHKIQHPVVQILLPRMGYNSNMPIDVIYGPQEAGGMGFIPLVTIQALQKIKNILQAYRHNTELSRHFQITSQWAQKVSGISNSIFSDTSIDIHSLHQEKWIQSLQSFLYQSNLQLILPHHYTPIPQRQEDQVLMDIVWNRPSILAIDKQYLNRCRIYLHVETIADITNAAGTHILSSAYFCMEEGVIDTTDHWPYQPRPGPTHRKKWRQFLDQFCDIPTLKLISPLGKWDRPSNRNWNAYYDPHLHTVLLFHDKQWKHYNIPTIQRRV